MASTDTAASDPACDVPPDAAAEGCRIRNRTLWELAQRDYLRGETAAQVCDRYGLSVSTLRDRARKGEWRKSDQPDPVPDEEKIDDSPVDCEALADDALLRVRRALNGGRAGEASSWMRLHEKLVHRLAEMRETERRRRKVDRERGVMPAPADHPAFLALEAALADARAGRPIAPCPPATTTTGPGAHPHPSHPYFCESGCDDEDHDQDPDDPDP